MLSSPGAFRNAAVRVIETDRYSCTPGGIGHYLALEFVEKGAHPPITLDVVVLQAARHI